jgi:hypothetical protein
LLERFNIDTVKTFHPEIEDRGIDGPFSKPAFLDVPCVSKLTFAYDI